MDAVLNRVSSPTFVGRADELAALRSALGRAATGVPAFAFPTAPKSCIGAIRCARCRPSSSCAAPGDVEDGMDVDSAA